MQKKIISCILAAMLVASTASIGVNAQSVKEEKSGDSVGTFFFDMGDWNYDDKVCFYIWDATTSEHASKSGWVGDDNWGSKKLYGKAVEGQEGVVESYELDLSGREDHNLFVIFHDPSTGAQTYDCVITPDAFGHTAVMTGNMLENPVDSEKQGVEVTFNDVDGCGPYKQITSTGNIIGTTSAPQDDGALIVAKYVFDKYDKIDKSGELCCTPEKVALAISEFGTDEDAVWAKFETFSGEDGYDDKKDGAKKLILGDVSDDDPTTPDDALHEDEIFRYGDVTLDGDITSEDALKVLQQSVGSGSLSGKQLELADVDHDGAITSNDALKILRTSVGLESIDETKEF